MTTEHELNVDRDIKLARLALAISWLRMISSRGLSPVLTEQELADIDQFLATQGDGWPLASQQGELECCHAACKSLGEHHPFCKFVRDQDPQARAALAQPSPAQAEQHWPKLEKPAQVGAIRFRAGLSSRLVVEAAQRLYEFESTPEKEAERIERLQAFREQCFEPLGAEFSKVLSENLVELSSEAKPEQAEAERPEVVASVVHSNPVVLGQCGPLNANDELMTVAQHAASVARWAEMFNRVEQQRDAALVEVERMRESKGDPVGSLEKCMKVMYERDEHAKRLEVALARVAELEAKLSYPTAVHQWQFSNAWFDGSEEAVLKAGKEGSPIRTLYTAPAQAQHSVPDGVTVNPEALRQVVRALVGPAHHIRELQVTASLPGSPITELVKQYNAWAAGAGGKEGV
ncbi:hypothetical protein ACVG01_17125 [Pseudomonas aeruginosa]